MHTPGIFTLGISFFTSLILAERPMPDYSASRWQLLPHPIPSSQLG